MNAFDPKTAFFALILAHFTLGAVLLPLRSQWTPSLERMANAMLAGGFGLFFLAMRGIAPDFISKILGNILVSMEFMFLYWSSCLYFGKTIEWYWKYVPPILSAIFFSLLDDQGERNIASGVIHGSQFVPTIILFLREGLQQQKTARLMMVAATAMLALQFWHRAITNIFTIPWIPEPNKIATADPITLFVALIAVMLLVTGMLMLHWDRSEANLRAQRDVAEVASENKSRFLAAASHDLRQPMQALTIYLDTLAVQHTTPAQKNLHAKVVGATKELGSLLDSLLDAARLDSGGVLPKPSAAPLDDFFQRLDEQFAPAAEQKSLRWKLAWPAGIVFLTDQNLFYTLIANLVSNAIKYTDKGGVMVTARIAQGRIKLQVWDTGIGVEREHRKKIFDEFYQINNPSRTREKGVGLGLSIVRRLTKLLSCDFNWRSIPGQGSCFAVTLPAGARVTQAAIELPAEQPVLDFPAHLQGIVLIEDDETIRDAIVEWCRSHLMPVTTYASAEEAMRGPMPSSFQFIIADYRLPGDLTGLEYLRKLEKYGGPLWAVIVTGETITEASPLASSEWPVLNKPIKPTDLMKTIHATAAEAGRHRVQRSQ